MDLIFALGHVACLSASVPESLFLFFCEPAGIHSHTVRQTPGWRTKFHRLGYWEKASSTPRLARPGREQPACCTQDQTLASYNIWPFSSNMPVSASR